MIPANRIALIVLEAKRGSVAVDRKSVIMRDRRVVFVVDVLFVLFNLLIQLKEPG